MSPDKRTEISIQGQVFRLRCEADEEERLRAVAELVEEKIAELGEAAGLVDTQRAALMAAFQFAYELHSQEARSFRQSSEYRRLQKRLKALVDEIDTNLSQ